MNNILTYDRNIVIYDGAARGTQVFKAEFDFTQETFKRDLTQRTSSELVINDEKNVVRALDLFFIPNYLGIKIVGRIDSVETLDNNSTYKRLVLFYGADAHTNEIYLANNSLVPNITVTNNQTLTQYINTSKAVITSNNFLDFDTLCRQAMRGTTCAETMRNEANKLQITISEVGQLLQQFSIDDPDITNKNIKFADDKFNILRLYNEENKAQFVTYYLGADGSVSLSSSKAQYPNIVNYEVVEADKYNSLSYATSVIRQQEYNNLIEFDIPLQTNIKALNFDDTFLGRRVRVWFSDGTSINSIISKYEIKDNVKINVSLGLTRTKLTEQLKKEA